MSTIIEERTFDIASRTFYFNVDKRHCCVLDLICEFTRVDRPGFRQDFTRFRIDDVP